MRKPPGAASLHGYAGPGDETLNETAPNANNELREFFDVLTHIESNDLPYFPSDPSFKDAIDEFRLESVKLADKLMRGIALYLGLPENELVKRHTHMKDRTVPTPTVIRTLMYSPIGKISEVKLGDDDVGEIRCGVHCDWLTITLLFQDLVGGLDVQTVSGEWVAATPIENSILLMSGDLMEIYSGGRLPATPHRVRIPDDTKLTNKPRQSLLYAPGPDANQDVEPLLPLPKESEGKSRSIYGPQSYKKMNAHEWVHKRHKTAATY